MVTVVATTDYCYRGALQLTALIPPSPASRRAVAIAVEPDVAGDRLTAFAVEIAGCAALPGSKLMLLITSVAESVPPAVPAAFVP